MKKIFHFIQLVGAIMFVCGVVFPFIVGTRISPGIYNILQIGGLALLLIGWLAKKVVKH